MKKIAAILGAGAMLLTMVGPAFARQSHHSQQGNSNVAFVNNATSAEAYSGVLGVGNGAIVRKADVSGEVEVGGNNTVTSGAANADAVGVVVANTQVGCSTCGRRGSSSTNNVAFVNNATSSVASSEVSGVGNGATITKADVGGRHGGEVEVSGNNTVTSGPSDASAVGVVVVNTQWNN